ncbi:toMV resistance protein Tm-2(2)-like [Lolium rigidum]|uniref:toMV resistance protein Tm-2(2)-like n=1 Tax=Lolium rigidum TaxID=89674 RepID=UPI001F5D60F9|nr:toMV resistance protein Tm-2(2)-like [Lolium rigidum]
MVYFVGFFARMIARRRLSGEIRSVEIILNKISNNRKYCRLEHKPSMAITFSAMAIAAWRDDLENAVGFGKDITILKGMLAPQNEGGCHPMFISIVGESGAGKNTLIKIICHQIGTEMDILIRYDMQPGCSGEEFLTTVYRMALRQLADRSQDQLVVEEQGTDTGDKLRHLLAGKRYLLILSGISSKTMLNGVRASLPDPDVNNDDGSRVMLILDTENEEVAWHANTLNKPGVDGVHLLTPLGQARSGQLFYWKALRKGQYELWLSASKKRTNWKREDDLNEEEEEDRNESYRDYDLQGLVYGATGGHPMAIVLLAGLLRFKQRHVQWNAIMQQLNHDNFHTQSLPAQLGNNTRRSLETIFWMSFEDLRDDLKSCFLYLAAYPKDTCHAADEIIQMWIAEGFIVNMQSQHCKTLEEVGHDYLKELVLRCLVELEEAKPGGGIQLVSVHRSLHGFLRKEVTESGFMEIIQDVKHDVLEASSARRISVQSDSSTMYTTQAQQKFPRLRSFICRLDEKQHGEAEAQQQWAKKKRVHHDIKFLRWSKFLRVVSIKGLALEELPAELGDMIHLRYLHLHCPELCFLPSSIVRLLNLQTLDITNTQVEEIDKDFWKIKTLRHVLANSLALPAISMSVGVEEDEASGELQTLHGVKPAASGPKEWSPLDNAMTRSLRSLEMHGFQYLKHGGPVFDAALQNMHLPGHFSPKGDKIPSCVFTEPSLRYLHQFLPCFHKSRKSKGVTKQCREGTKVHVCGCDLLIAFYLSNIIQ